MGYPSYDEQFLKLLREANIKRNDEFCTKTQNETGVYPVISALFRALELTGEVGELGNIVKKFERHTMGMFPSNVDRKDLENEIADVLICLDLLAMDYDVNLEEVVRDKFKASSDKFGLTTVIETND